MILRIFFDAVLFYLALFYLGWMFFIAGIVAVFIFDNFYEFIFFSLAIDFLYGFPVDDFYGFRFIFTSLAILFLLIGKITRKSIRTF